MATGLQNVSVLCPRCSRTAWLRVEWPSITAPPRAHSYECRGGCALSTQETAALLPPWLPYRA